MRIQVSRKQMIRGVLLAGWAALVVPLVSIELALLITPGQKVEVAGQTLQLSAGPAAFSNSGPGTLELFGQAIPTTQQFSGPIRPVLHWAEVTNYGILLQAFKQPGHLGEGLRKGWSAYFGTELVIAILLGMALATLGLLLVRQRWRMLLLGLGVAGLVTGAVDAMGIGSATAGLSQLATVRTLDQLVGHTPLSVVSPGRIIPARSSGIVVIGDSTAAGAGNPLVPGATPEDKACQRSLDSYGSDIAAVSHSGVVNLACSNASIEAGLFNSETINGEVVPAQLATLTGMTGVHSVLVSIGANEMHWADFMELCLVSPECDDSASAALFAQALDSFTVDYYDLLQDLAGLPGHPLVIINEYYDPISVQPNCPGLPGLTAAKAVVLGNRLGMFNAVLGDGAASFGFTTATPSFVGHELCSPQPFVQGLGQSAPLHPNAAGELVIALADEQALLNPPSPRTDTTTPPSPVAAQG